MKIYKIRDRSGRAFAFEISRGWSSRRKICSTIRKTESVNLTRTPRFLSWFREEEFCEFEIGQIEFHVFEPFGDNSRYWVGPKDSCWHPEIEAVIRAFSGENESS